MFEREREWGGSVRESKEGVCVRERESVFERERESGKVVFGRELGGGERVGGCVCEGECVSLRERESGEGVCV